MSNNSNQQGNVTFTILRLETVPNDGYCSDENNYTISQAVLELLEWETVSKQDYALYQKYVEGLNYSRRFCSSEPFYAIVQKTDFENKENNAPNVDFSLEHVRQHFKRIEDQRLVEEEKRKEAAKKKAEVAERKKLEKAAKTLLTAVNLQDIATEELKKLIEGKQ